MTTEKLGRISLLKYCMVTLMVVLIVPLVVGVIFQLALENAPNVIVFYKNLYQEITDNMVLLLINSALVGLFIWFAGSIVAQFIIRYNKPKFVVGGLCFLVLWLVLFTGTAITDAIMNSTRWGRNGWDSAILGWLRYGLPMFVIYGGFHGLAMGYLLGNEVKNKGREMEITTR